MKKKIINLFVIFLLLVTIFTGCNNSQNSGEPLNASQTQLPEKAEDLNKKSTPLDIDNKTKSKTAIDEGGSYTSKKDVALYIHTYNKLPLNFITKKKAIELGWKSEKGNLWEVTDKMSIGGDVFSNREGSLPSKNGRKWFECDVNYKGGFRGAERIVYSNDGLIYYTDDHYKTFTKIY